MTTVDVHLFGKPEWEIDLDKATPQDLKDLGENLRDRLSRISEIVEKLENSRWGRSGGLYDIFFYKRIKKEDAKKELEKLGIEEDEININDFGEEDDEFVDIDPDEEKII